jgi:hypothetical protein
MLSYVGMLLSGSVLPIGASAFDCGYRHATRIALRHERETLDSVRAVVSFDVVSTTTPNGSGPGSRCYERSPSAHSLLRSPT